ncbi:hypothetical protein ATEIFO6365_0013007900 [Aspergillus terreus]|uniref:MARVEL domain-containing protein n=1 Tax=Aspergillus terreus TaxID=33178 RepID=A0A5M3ZFS7_ASPTE|nr:hypothetical protein ATETN484_0014007900 [Aspergillus terreus]GFF20745.1 hypothetical protein ATEIFO6365_0013007900 [Aspergillus terreus]
MAYTTAWLQPVRGVQTLFGIAVFGLIIYILAVYKYDAVTKLMLFNSIWAGFVATPYLALAPVHFPRIAHYLVIPVVEASTFILWLVGVILLGIDLPSAGNCHFAACEATQAAVVLSALECALFFVTTIRAVLAGIQLHKNRHARTEEAAPTASGAMEQV